MSKFVWYDLMTKEPKAAATFYCAVMGWQARAAEVADNDYTIFSMGETRIAGLFPLPEEVEKHGCPAAWSGYIYVDDVDATAKRVPALGGEICREPWDIPEVGRVAVVIDPHGARFLIFTPISKEHQPPVAVGTPGHIGWHELHSIGWANDFSFYAELFGWTKAEAVDMGDIGIYQQFAIDGQTVGGMMKQQCESPRGFWMYYFNVANITESTNRVTEFGGKVLREPQEVPGGSWIAQCVDPQGGHFALVGPKV